MNLTFTKVRLSSLHEQALALLSLPTPSPTRASGAIPHFTLNSRGNRHQSLWRCSLIRMRVMELERRQVSTSSVCSLPPSASSVQPKKGFDASWRGTWPRGKLGLREPDHSALCKPPKGGRCTNEQTHRNFQWAQKAVLL